MVGCGSIKGLLLVLDLLDGCKNCNSALDTRACSIYDLIMLFCILLRHLIFTLDFLTGFVKITVFLIVS